MGYGEIKHKRSKVWKASQHGWGILRAGPKVHIKIQRWHGWPKLKSAAFKAQACFFPGGKAGTDSGRGGRAVYLNVRRRRLWDRCGEGSGNSPTKAAKRALRDLSRKKL